jgi:hypothetical protein
MSENGYSSALTNIYNTLTSSFSAIDFGDLPEDGNPFLQPNFTGGNPVLFPEEHDGRVGESIKTAGYKINNNFTTIVDTITGLYGYVSNLKLLTNDKLEYSVSRDSIDSSVGPGMCVYVDGSGIYKPFTYSDRYDKTCIGVYMQDGILDLIYTNGYASNINTTLSAGNTYGLLSGSNSAIPERVDDSYSYICNDAYIPIFRAVNETDGILLSHSVTISLSSAYI